MRHWLAMLLWLCTVPAWAANDYYNHGNFPSPSSPATSASMRAELDLIAAGFAKLPSISGNPNRAVVVNGGGTGLTLTTGTFSLAGNFAVTGAFDTTLVQTASTTLTLPGISGTLSTLAGAEILSNKQLSSPVISGTVTGTSTWTGATSLLSASLTSPSFSGTVTGTYALGGTSTIIAPQISSPVFSGTATGVYTLAGTPSITSPIFSGTVTGTYTMAGTGTYTAPLINSGTVGADPTAALGIASKQYADALGFTTGDVKLTLKTTADTGYVLMNDGTIGSATSGATTRANADTQSLYTLLWTNIVDQWAPVTGGRGASAAADFAANKPMRLPKTLGRALAGYGTGTVFEVGSDADTATDQLTVASNNAKWITGMSITFTLTSGTITGLTSGNPYFIIRTSATTIKLASTLANAQNGTAVDMTAKSSPIWTLTHTYTTRALGEEAGEQTHAQSVTELLSHSHASVRVPGGSASVTGGVDNIDSTGSTASTGGNAAMNILQPTLFLSVMIKL